MAKVVIRGDTDAAERRSLTRSISSAFQAFHASLTLLTDPRIAAPYLIYFVIQMLLLAAYLAGNTGPLALPEAEERPCDRGRMQQKHRSRQWYH